MKFRFYYSGVRVKNLERSLRFYTEGLGMKVISRGRMPHGGRYVHLKTPGSPQRLELNWYPRNSRFYTKYNVGEGLDHLAFIVDDIQGAFKQLLKKGATAAVSPAHSQGTEVYVKDPNGIWIELLH